ncbi:MAG: DUF1549 and DUF1553 domain-containing protein [Planctomycetota bacterium]|jgi:hypothetical protein
MAHLSQQLRICLSAILALNVLVVQAADDATAPAAEQADKGFSDEERSHWSFQPLDNPQVPTFTSEIDRNWISTPIDAFVLRRLKAEGLQPAPQGSRRVLARRLSFALTGLPPTPELLAEFEADTSFDAWPRLIEHFLASPHYGEKWGQHWLDVVRFAESEGFEYDRHHKEAWRFRDYVVRSFNENKPFNVFATEQLCGDELARQYEGDDPRKNAELRDVLVAAGFHRLGPVRRNAGNPEIAFSRNEVLTEMTNAVGTVFLSLSVGCARCHDHFFDPFPQKDYYRLQAFLAETHEFDAPYADPQEWSQWKARHDDLTQQIYELKQKYGNANGKEAERIKAQIVELQGRLPEPLSSIFSVAGMSDQRTPIHLLDRGDETKKLQPVGMRVPSVLLDDDVAALPQDTVRPKTRLANWITSPDNPLTTRVIVNRIWQYHFGRGLVPTANDFGMNGEPPSHPELLDWLTLRFIASDWDIKSLHRLILLSNVWQQSSVSPQQQRADELDPNNALLWHMPRRRLTAEELRDSLLTISGELNDGLTGPSVMVPVSAELTSLLYKPTQWEVTADTSQHNRRTVYLIAKRNLRLPFMEAFDQPDLQTSCARRESSTHAPQALELLNGSLSNRLAESFTSRLQSEAGTSPERIVHRAFLLTTGRLPTTSQQRTAIQFLERHPLREFALAMFNVNAFLYVE